MAHANHCTTRSPTHAMDRFTSVVDSCSPAVDSESSPSSPPSATGPLVHHTHSVDIDGRRYLWSRTAVAGLLGGTAGAFFSVYSGYPLHRAVAQSAFNWSLVTFSYLGCSLLCAELAGLPSSSLSNHLVAGSLTFTSLLSLQAASQGRVTSLRDARRIGVRGAAVGAVCGGGVWTVQHIARWWHQRRRSQQQHGTTDGMEKEDSVGEQQQHSVGDSGSVSDVGWLPEWSPVRVSTDADLARADRVKAERTKRAHQLQQLRWEQQRQQ